MAQRMRARLRHAEITARYERGEPHAQIAREMGISVALSSHVCRAAGLGRDDGIEARRDPTNPWHAQHAVARRELEEKRAALAKAVLELRAQGLLHREIAERLGTYTNLVGKVCRAAGDRRPRAENPRRRGR